MPVTSVLAQVQIAALCRRPLLALRYALELGERLLDVVGEDIASAEAVDERQYLRAGVAVVERAPDFQEDGAALRAERVGAVHDAHDLDVLERLGVLLVRERPERAHAHHAGL